MVKGGGAGCVLLRGGCPLQYCWSLHRRRREELHAVCFELQRAGGGGLVGVGERWETQGEERVGGRAYPSVSREATGRKLPSVHGTTAMTPPGSPPPWMYRFT
jgi:hypothetical protein